MSKYIVENTGETPSLGSNNFKTKGGEGSIYIDNGMVYKICEPGKMIPESKFKELQALDHPKIIRPENRIFDRNKNPVGYTMRLVPGDAVPLARILTKQYRQRENVKPETMMELVRQLVEGTRFIHSHPGYLLVDANEYNFMVPTDNYDAIYFIDVNSYETPKHPATAIMMSIRDWQVKQAKDGRWKWTQDSDWYSIGILTFYMFTGIHPFKGDHPNYTNVKTFWQEQMKDNISVLRPDVSVPEAAVYYPFEDIIPGGADGAYMQWYRSMFIDGERLPAPENFQATIKFVAKIREIVGSNSFSIQELHEMPHQIVGYYARSGKEIIATKNHVFSNGIKWRRPKNRFRCGFTPIKNIPYSCEFLDSGRIQLTNLNDGKDIPIDLMGHDIMSTNGRVYVLSEKAIFEITFIEKSFFVASAYKVASIMPNATTLYQGCAVQNVIGRFHFSVFPETKSHYQYIIEELDDYQIVEAKYENNILMVICLDPNGQYDRFIIRTNGSKYEVFRKIENINPVGLNFTVNDNGICACVNEEEKVEIFSSKMGHPKVNCIDDPAVKTDMKLCHHGQAIQFAHGRKIYSISVKK